MAAPEQSRTPTIIVPEHVGTGAVDQLCEQVRLALEGTGATTVECDVAALLEPDLGWVDVLARCQLAALQRGGQFRLNNASAVLRELLSLAGLDEILREAPGLNLEAGRQIE